MCPIHYVKYAKWYSVLVTLSTLNGWRSNFIEKGKYDRDKIHLDEISIPRAKVQDLYVFMPLCPNIKK